MVSGEILLGLALSLLFARGFPLQRLWVSLIIVPLAASPVVAIVIWKYMFAPNFGIINYTISLFGVKAPEWFVSKVYAFLAIGIIDIWLNAPFTFTILYPAIISINPELFSAAKIDGANYVGILRYVTLPLIRPILLTVSTFRVIFVLRLFAPIWLFAGGGPGEATKVLSIYLYEKGFSYFQFGLGSSIAWILLIITMVVALPQVREMYKTMFSSVH
jgi:multiple sugar transport system permease protein